MRLFSLSAFRPDNGHCWLADLPSDVLPGEGVERTGPSSLRVFEDSRELGPASATHDQIRIVGGGAFSHWGRQLYFSSSDNTSPTENKRTYSVLAPESIEEIQLEARRQAAVVAHDADLLQACLSRSLSTQGAEFHSIYSLRALLSVLQHVGHDLAGRTVLEIGASPSHGLSIALALLGARKVIVNNVQAMGSTVPMAYARNISVLAGLMTPLRRRLSEVVTPVGDCSTGALKAELFDVLSSTDAAALPALAGRPDLVFSMSVLEHIRHLPDVLRKLRGSVAPDALSVHWIDLRDHTCFDDPLKFLRLSEPEFLAGYSTEHNRWRRAEYIRMFTESGWQVVRERFAGRLPSLSKGTTDMLAVAEEGPERIFVDDPRKLPRVAPGEVAALSPEYRSLPPEELAVMVLEVVAKPA